MSGERIHRVGVIDAITVLLATTECHIGFGYAAHVSRGASCDFLESRHAHLRRARLTIIRHDWL